ncbi:MAG: hypothetical protein WCA20_01185 [Candidatus Sulfotelmatobacter sp.]
MIARLAVALLAVACFASEQNPNQLYGRWKVTAVSGASPITAMSGAAAARLVGRFLILRPHKLQFAGQTCQPTYDRSQETSAEFVQDYKVDLKTLSLPEPVARFDAGCTAIFVREPDKIIFPWNGYFLEATKALVK